MGYLLLALSEDKEDGMNQKTIIYVDLDDTLCDYKGAFECLKESSPEIAFPQSQQGFYEGLKPLSDAIGAFHWLCKQAQFDVYILTAPSIYNPLCYSEKRRWVEQHLGIEHVHRLIISYHKNLLIGDYLIDDKAEGRGQESFEGELIHFGASGLRTWRDIKRYISKHILSRANSKMLPHNQHTNILCFRSFDMRDHFPEPVETFMQALELLQSDRAYLPEESSEIVCYLKNGETLKIPQSFYCIDVPRFNSESEAREWLLERNEDIGNEPSWAGFGLAIANASLSIDEQIMKALAYSDKEIISSTENDRVYEEVNAWLNQSIDALTNVKPSDVGSNNLGRLRVAAKKYYLDNDLNAPLSSEEIEKNAKELKETIAFFKAGFEDLKNPKRWVITTRDYALSGITGNAYFDVVNNNWLSKISDAACIKDKQIADAIIGSFGEDSFASVIEHFVSQKELAKSAIKIENDPAVIFYHPESETYLYEEINRFSDYKTHALISLTNPVQFTIQRNHPGQNQLFVSIPDIAMDALALAWSNHRKS